jgi:hypothetical protein
MRSEARATAAKLQPAGTRRKIGHQIAELAWYEARHVLCFVVPAKAGVHGAAAALPPWIPASAGMTIQCK